MRILIVGHPGSGKTYLAGALSERFSIERVDIDTLYDRHPMYLFSKKLYKRAFMRLFEGKEDWVIDGYHVGRMPDDIVKRIDTLIYLHLPKKELKNNILNRYKTKKLGKDYSHWQAFYVNNLKNYTQINFRDNALRSDLQRIKSSMAKDAKYIELATRNDQHNLVALYNTVLSERKPKD